jgi:Protein of unknown function (DUF3575)
MKKTLLITLLFAQIAHCHAQLDIKVNALGLLFSNPDLSVEFSPTKQIAFEPSLGISYAKTQFGLPSYTSKGLVYGLMGKYYFTPNKGFDKIYAGIYVRRGDITYTRVFQPSEVFKYTYEVVGLAVGYKWVLTRNFVFDFTTGYGKKLSSRFEKVGNSNTNLDNFSALDFDYMLRLGIGYRFGGGNKERFD